MVQISLARILMFAEHFETRWFMGESPKVMALCASVLNLFCGKGLCVLMNLLYRSHFVAGVSGTALTPRDSLTLKPPENALLR
jgi:hypothetical protein